ncbi:MAG: FAD-dependent oxidoreductase, partial [Chloroflexota bacterium]
IGVSAAKALARRQAQVSLIAGSPRVLSTLLDEEASALAERALVQAGVKVITQSGGERITRRNSLNVALGSGETVTADLVVVGRGVRPNLELTSGTPIQVEKGIVVDRHMETSVADIFACGDVAQAFDIIYEQNRLNPNWPNAFRGGRVAGYNMAGSNLTFAGIGSNSLNLFGLPIMAAGRVAPEEGWDVLYRRGQGVYKKLLLHQGRLMGLIMVGDIRRSGIIVDLLRQRVDVRPFQKSLLAEDFGLASLPVGLRHQMLERAKQRNESATAV